MKAFKALEAHSFFTSGHVSIPVVKEVSPEHVFLGKVNHSQSGSLPPLRLWILASKDGEIVCAHCNCMAGLGETCSHVAAVVFMVEYAVKKLDGMACTEDINKWLPPTAQSVSVDKVHRMDWKSSESRLTALIEDSSAPSDNEDLGCLMKLVEVLSKTATVSFWDNVKQTSSRASLCSTLEPYCEAFIPPPIDSTIPKLLTSLWDPACADMEYEELVAHCGVVFGNLSVTADQVQKVEKIAKKQSKCEKWYQLRRGRITASVMKMVCRGNVAKPAISTINKICHKQKELKTEHVMRGKKMEQVARKLYERRQGDKHVVLSVQECDLFICQDYPFIAASPDCIVSCSCCEKGGIEIKSQLLKICINVWTLMGI